MPDERRMETLKWGRGWFKQLSALTETSNPAEWAENSRKQAAEVLVQIEAAIKAEEAK